jgi:hypothetical protein
MRLPENGLLPPLDVDIIWHTHQLVGTKYWLVILFFNAVWSHLSERDDTFLFFGVYIDHNDDITAQDAGKALLYLLSHKLILKTVLFWIVDGKNLLDNFVHVSPVNGSKYWLHINGNLSFPIVRCCSRLILRDVVVMVVVALHLLDPRRPRLLNEMILRVQEEVGYGKNEEYCTSELWSQSYPLLEYSSDERSVISLM